MCRILLEKSELETSCFFGEKDELIAEVIDNTTSGGRTLRFLFDGTHEEFKQVITALGETPIPKHLERQATAQDAERYQTVYAKHEGAVAAPTAGLHFSKLLMKQLELIGVEFAETTLRVGLGTFSDIMVEDLFKHRMESELSKIDIPEKAVLLENITSSAKTQGKISHLCCWNNSNENFGVFL